MNVFYNKNGIGDTLIVSIKEGDRSTRAFERSGDVARIYDTKTSATTGLVNEILRKNSVDEQFEPVNRPNFVVGKVTNKEKHPDADKLSVCQVDVGDDSLQIVCGAPNVDKGQKVVVANVGAMMPSGTLIKDAQLRGVDSTGMICSAKELDLPDAPSEKGILVLTDDYRVGDDFFKADNH